MEQKFKMAGTRKQNELELDLKNELRVREVKTT